MCAIFKVIKFDEIFKGLRRYRKKRKEMKELNILDLQFSDIVMMRKNQQKQTEKKLPMRLERQ
jgi:hypothetical protein